MHPSALLLALVTAPSVFAHVAARQTGAVDHGAMDPAPVATGPAAPAVTPPTADEDGEVVHDGMSEEEHDDMMSPRPVTTIPTTTQRRPSAYADLAKCELAIDTLLKAFNMVPTPNAALSSFLAVETAAVADPCEWAGDVPHGLGGAYSAYSSNMVDVLEDHADLVTQLVSCVDAGGASVTRAEIVTPLFSLPDCKQASTTQGGAFETADAEAGAEETSTRRFPTGGNGGASSTSTAGAARQTGMAVAGVAAAALLGVAGVL